MTESADNRKQSFPTKRKDKKTEEESYKRFPTSNHLHRWEQACTRNPGLEDETASRVEVAQAFWSELGFQRLHVSVEVKWPCRVLRRLAVETAWAEHLPEKLTDNNQNYYIFN